MMYSFWDDEFYDEDDYECFDNTSEVDEIIGKAMSDVADHFKQGLKDAVAETKQAEKELACKKSEISQLDWQIEDKKATIEELNRKIEETEQTEIPRKYLNGMIKSATGGHVPGDKVWTYHMEYIHKDCNVCNNKGKVNALLSGKEIEITCPKCHGWKHIDYHSFSPVQKTASRVILKLCFDDNRVSYWGNDVLYLDHNDFSTSPKYIWESKEEAQKWCDEENKKELKELD